MKKPEDYYIGGARAAIMNKTDGWTEGGDEAGLLIGSKESFATGRIGASSGCVLLLDHCAGDGVGIERTFDNGKTWSRVGYINTGATNSTVDLAQDLVDAYNEKHR